MSLVPELVFQTIIVRGIRALREDARFIDQLFRNLSSGDQQQMRDFIKSNAVDLIMNYPRTQLSLPAIVLTLQDEKELHAFLNDTMGYETPDEFSYDGDDDIEVLGGTVSTTSISDEEKTVFGPHRVLSATLNTIKVSDRTFQTDSYMGGSYKIRIVAGTGVGQTRIIATNNHNTVMTSINWQTTPDSSSVFEITKPLPEILGTPAKLYDRSDNNLFVERKGAIYTVRYRAEVLTPTPEQTIYLYAILKAIFFISRNLLEKQGIMNLRMNGSDLGARPEYAPEHAFMRVLSLEFECPFDIFVEETSAASDFILCLLEGNELAEVSNTTVDLTSTPAITGP